MTSPANPSERLCQRGKDLAAGECQYLKGLRRSQPGMADLTRLGCMSMFLALQKWGLDVGEDDCPYAYAAAENTAALRMGVDIPGMDGTIVNLDPPPEHPTAGHSES